MAKVILYASEYITVEYHPDDKLIFHQVHRPIGKQSKILKEALNAGTEAMKKHGIHKWVSDDRRNDALDPDLETWGNTVWIPKTIEAGWKYWANVVPEDIHAAGSLVPAIEGLHKFGLKMRVFVEVEDAFKWIKEADA